MQKVSLVAPVKSIATKGLILVTKSIEVVLVSHAVGSGLPAARGLSYMVASTEYVTPGAKTNPRATGSNVGLSVCVSNPPSILKV